MKASGEEVTTAGGGIGLSAAGGGGGGGGRGGDLGDWVGFSMDPDPGNERQRDVGGSGTDGAVSRGGGRGKIPPVRGTGL